MTEVLFYHLTEHTLEQTIPGLLERSLERGWRVVIQAATDEQIDALDKHLWTYKPDSFLPHGKDNGEEDEGSEHPIWMTTATNNPNGANIRFLVGDAIPAGIAEYERVIYLFDGRDDDAVQHARERWKIEKNAGHDLTYWQQDEAGRWNKKA